MVHALRVLRHHLLGVRRPQPFGCWTAWTDFDLADRQLGDRVEQNEATSEKDARPMARGDRGPPLRRDAPARFSENDGSPVAGQLRRWRRPRSINGRPGPREPAGALLATRSRRANPGAACVHPRRVGEHSTLRRGRLRKRPRGDCKPLHTAMRVVELDPKPTLPTHQSGARPPRPAQARAPPAILPSRRGGMVWLDWIAGRPTTAAGFDTIQNHVDLLSGYLKALSLRRAPSTRARQRRQRTRQ